MMFERTQAEEWVAYRVFIKDGHRDRAVLSDLAEQLRSELESETESYLWHCQGIQLIVSEDGTHLTGRTTYGDNIEDEWKIVSLFAALSARHEDIYVQIEDADGEFMLVEAALHIPSWLEPETAQNRVFLYLGEIHVLPPPTNPAELFDAIVASPHQAAAILNANTRASQRVQQAIRARTQSESEWTQRHVVHASVPHAARVLQCRKIAALCVHELWIRSQYAQAMPFVMQAQSAERAERAERISVALTRALYGMFAQCEPSNPLCAHHLRAASNEIARV
jgi:hypothetical protein